MGQRELIPFTFSIGQLELMSRESPPQEARRPFYQADEF